MEGQDDGDGHDSHVDGQPEVGQKGPLVGAVVAGVRGLVLEEQGSEEGPYEEGVLVAEVGGGVAGEGRAQWGPIVSFTHSKYTETKYLGRLCIISLFDMACVCVCVCV